MFSKKNPQFPNIRRQNATTTQAYADSFEEKADIFAKIFFPTPLIIDLNDIIKYIYSSRIPHDENLTEKKVMTVIRRFRIYKTSGSNGISNNIL